MHLLIPDDVKLCSSLHNLWGGQKANIDLTSALAVKVEIFLFKHVLGRFMKLSEYLTAVWLKIQVFWDVPLSLGDQFPVF